MSTPNPRNPKNIRALFLSFGGVIHSLKTGKIQVDELDRCLFVCSGAQVNQSDRLEDPMRDAALAALAAARDSGRLLFQSNEDAPTFVRVSEFLVQHGLPELLGAIGDDRTVAHIPFLSAVPSVIDKVIEVIWAEIPLSTDWKKSWGVK